MTSSLPKTGKPIMEELAMAKKAQSNEFKIPLALLKAFKSDVRTIPKDLAPNGYIIFDHAMLTSILRSNDEAARIELAKQLDKMAEAGGKLVVMG
jgi:hypothetical protein